MFTVSFDYIISPMFHLTLLFFFLFGSEGYKITANNITVWPGPQTRSDQGL